MMAINSNSSGDTFGDEDATSICVLYNNNNNNNNNNMPSSTLDTLGHHCVTCRCGRDVTTRHNALRNVLYTTLHRAGLSAHLDEGSSWSIEKPKSRPADNLVANWDRGQLRQ